MTTAAPAGPVPAVVMRAFLAATLALTGCASELDTRRESVDTGTFGNTVMTLVCKRVAYMEDLGQDDGRVDVRGDAYRELCRGLSMPPADAPAALKAVQAERPGLVAAIDALLPEAFLHDVQGYVTSDDFLQVYDSGIAAAAVDAIAGMLEMLAGDDDSVRAFERFGLRAGYTPTSAGLGLIQTMLDYPDLPDFLLHTTTALAPGGAAHDAFGELCRALAVTMRNAGPAQPDESDTVSDDVSAQVLDVLLREMAVLDTGRVMPAVLRDSRGVSHVMAEATGVFASPFVDVNGDGLADTDELGRFVDAGGAFFAAPAPFAPAGASGLHESPDDPPWITRDAHDLALRVDSGAPVYRYVDLDDTVLAALGRDAPGLVAPALDLLVGASALMGPRQPAGRVYENGERIDYTGFDTGASALLDMLYGYSLLLGQPAIHDTLELFATLLMEREAELARLAEALVSLARLADMFPDAALEPGSPLFDDLIPVLAGIADTPGLLPDLLGAMEDPRVIELGARFRAFMLYKDAFYYDPSTGEVAGALATRVDRDAPNSGFNRSIWQRALHLLADARGASLCNKYVTKIDLGAIVVNKTYDECELFSIPDLAVFYVRAMAFDRDADGNFHDDKDGDPVHAAVLELNWQDPVLDAAVTDELLELVTGIDGFGEHPTPQALNRTLFLDPQPALFTQLMEPPRTRHGELFIERHAGTLPAWELDGFYDQVQPLVQPFVDHHAEHLFVDLMAVLHTHWPARDSADHQQDDPGAAGYAWASNAASYEPCIADVLAPGGIVSAVVDTAPALAATTIASGRSYPDIVSDAAGYFLTPRIGLVNRHGMSTSTTADGRPVYMLSPWQVLADAYEQKQALMSAAPERAAAWNGAVSALVDVLVRGDQDSGDDAAAWHFRNPRVRGVGVAMLDFVATRVRAHDQAGDRAEWLSRDLPGNLEQIMGGPVVAALMDLGTILADHADARAARAAMEALVAYLFDDNDSQGTGFDGAVTALADMAQLVVLDDRDMVPLIHVLAELFDPERGWLDAFLRFALSARLAEGDLSGVDKPAEKSVLVRLLRNGYAEYRPGHTPLGDIAGSIAEVHRQRPFVDLTARLTSADYRSVFTGVADFLDNEARGLRKFLAIIENRALE